jgi:hypothetical protein
MAKRRKKRRSYHFKPQRPHTPQKPKYISKVHENSEPTIEPINEQSGFWDKVVPKVFYYPTSSPLKKSFWFLINTATLWIILIFGICRFIFKIPDYRHVPKPMLELSGSLLIFAGTIHTGMIFRLIWNIGRNRVITYDFLKLIAVEDTYARILSSSGIIIIIIYANGVNIGFSHFLQGLFPTLGEKIIHAASDIYAICLSLITSVLGNFIYAKIVKFRRKAKIQKLRNVNKDLSQNQRIGNTRL